MDDEQDSTFINIKTNTPRPEKKRKKHKSNIHVELSNKNLDNVTDNKVLKENKRPKKDTNKYNLNYVRLFKEIPQRIPFLGKPRDYTISVALPVSIMENIQSDDLRAYVIGNIARTLTIYGVNEVVLYNDLDDKSSNWMEYFSLNLRYLETPQYLRKFLFPMDNALKFAGLQNPINAPHHLRSTEWLPYREGVVGLIRKDSTNTTLYADCGVFSSVKIHNKEDLKEFYGIEYMTDEDYDVYQRVTVRLDDESIDKCHKNWKEGKSLSQSETGSLSAYLVHPEEPLKVAGLYWGYIVRECNTVVESLKGCPFNENARYDLKVGTSERGELYSLNTKLPKFKNMLIYFGPVLGLEHVMQEPEKKFDKYFNFCNQQKSRTIRTEEALLIVLSLLSFTNTF
ncbi:putative RNA methyltransferase family protein [Theileria parva strain Muguga]|uniref:RNA methyltransferase n=1 Tax=Theileria parva TaxID=5875 RepID=Q4N8U6_THEPA|nr:putative RNA methyltransferase family protein [Theileria parva strain Muguga]EAN33612.1 putative RNA methyltransferase family protein [Theileria parva strain Muguga]|eukprot:XP_765895.1 hypothetical protein [Theileria parva strain Muguga]